MRVLLIALIAYSLLGAQTKPDWPACPARYGPLVFIDFTQALLKDDDFILDYYTKELQCGILKDGLTAEILEKTKGLVRARIFYNGRSVMEVWTAAEAIEDIVI